MSDEATEAAPATVVVVAGGPGTDSAGLHPPPGAEAPPPLPAVAEALADAVATGVAVGEATGRAEATATDALTREAEQRTRAETAEARVTALEAENTTLRARVTELEAPPVVEAAVTEVTVDTPATPDSANPSAVPHTPRTGIAALFLGR